MTNPPSPVEHTPAEVLQDRLDRIVRHLENIDRRDKLRTFGGFVGGLIRTIPIILLVWSTWYFIQHGQELMKTFTDQAAQAAANATKEQSSDLLQQAQKMMGR